jgi:hypothetical protein
LFGSVTVVTRPEKFNPNTSARPDADVSVLQDVAAEGQAPDPGAGLL